MLKNIALFFTATFLVVLIFGFVLPNNYEITRTVTINAPVEKVHSHLNDLEKWPAWAPWHKQGSEVVIELGKISQGVGASQTWIGEGKGSLEITQSSPTSGIEYLLRFGEDTQDTKGTFAYQAKASQTDVTWTMAGEMTMPVIGPYAVLIMDMIAGPMLEKGMQSLKGVVEGKAPTDQKVAAE